MARLRSVRSCRILRLLAWLALLAGTGVQSQTARFDPESGTLEIGCVALYDGAPLRGPEGGPLAYRAALERVGSRFFLASAAPLEAPEECSGRFEAGVYTDVVRVGDRAFEARLEADGEGAFTLASHRLLGPADTSLWRVIGPGGALFLGGAIHVLDDASYPLPESYEDAYGQADRVVLETLPTAAGGAGIQDYLLAARRDDGLRLSDQLSADTYRQLRFHMDSVGLVIDVFQNWYVPFVADLLVTLELERLGFGAQGVDGYYGRRAIQDGKPVSGLETAQSQFEVLQGLYGGLEDPLIRARIDLIEAGRLDGLISRDILAWREGDIGFILREDVLPLQAAIPEDYESLLAQRNRAWLPRIEAMLASPEVELVLVGVAHIPGEDGLLQLLRERGFTVEYYRPVPF